VRYLLIDFGASFLKLATYDTTISEKRWSPIYDQKMIKSPFVEKSVSSRKELMSMLRSIVSTKFDRVVCCSILGGGWHGDNYYSWKSSEPNNTHKSCLISGLFNESPYYHTHEHHGGHVTGLNLLGYINTVPIYSSLGDTDCVINSIEIDDNEYVVNMGTGSQVITKQKNQIIVNKYIPAGRTFLCYDKFLSELGVDLFDQLHELTVNEILESNIKFDLNIFPQSVAFGGGGSITNLHECSLTKSNFFGSLVRSFVEQYGVYFSDEQKTKIKLTGGIPKKLPALKQVFSEMYGKDVIIDTSATPFKGMVNYIKEWL